MNFTRIDTHHHIMPPRWLEVAGRHIYEAAVGIPVEWIKEWSPSKAIDVMDRTGIGVAVASVATPSVSFAKGEEARRLARECNQFGAKMISDHPGRFGIFATVPMPDVEGTLREIEHALDVLKLDGIVFMTNFGATWPGDPAYREVFDELNRRKAIAFFHPHVLYSNPIVQPETNRPAMNSLLSLVPVSQVLFGTDFPYMRAERNAEYFDRMGFDMDEHASISRRNAVRLMPRLAKLVKA